MYQTKFCFICFLFILFISACSVTMPESSVPLKVSITALPNSTAIEANLLIALGTPTYTETSQITTLPTLTMTPSPSQTSTLIPTIVPNTGPTCSIMTLLSEDTLSLLPLGSILVRTYREDGLWAFSKGLAEPHFIIAPVEDMVGLVFLSPNGTQVAFEDAAHNIILYDLPTGETTLVPWQESWIGTGGVMGWNADGRIELFVKSEALLGEGVTLESFLVDPITLQGESIIHEFSLPDYYFDDKNPFHGFASWNPSKTLVVYTVSLPYEGVRYILRDVVTNEELWRSSEIDGEVIPMVDWSEDGSRFLMAITPPRKRNLPNPGPIELASLEIDDLHYEVLAQLISLPNTANILHLDWSVDRHFVFFSLRETPFHGPGYILDTGDGSVRQICESNFANGQWLSETNQLLYVIATNDEQYELKLLDAQNWQVQSLWHIDQYPYTIGWTPVTFSEP